MLVLARRVDEQIRIGEGERAITVTVVRVHGGIVRIGIDAPKDTPVHRAEVAERIKVEGRKRRERRARERC